MSELTPAESRDLRCIAGMMIPASSEFDVPGADDPAIFADVLGTMGRDTAHVREALRQVAGLADMDAVRRDAAVMALRERGGVAVATLSRVILQCYYRDDRVVRSLGLEPRPPFPKGHTLEQGDWSLLDPVRKRAKMWRDA
jgi:hypothetical protein